MVIGYSFAVVSNDGAQPFSYGMTGPAVTIESSVLPTDLYGKKMVLAHELGHFFGLLHCNNYSYTTGYELFDRSNGVTTGDFCYDTPAEYNSFFVDTNCVLIPALLIDTDAHGDTLHPDPYNIMSSNVWSQKCRKYFTAEQIKRIKYYHTTYLSHLSKSSCNGSTAVAPIAMQQPAIRIAPNPTTGIQQITIDCARPVAVQIDLYSTTGQLVQHISQTPVTSSTTVLQADLSKLPPGIYYYRIATDEMIQYRKAMKR